MPAQAGFQPLQVTGPNTTPAVVLFDGLKSWATPDWRKLEEA